jgi:hypothetical protein
MYGLYKTNHNIYLVNNIQLVLVTLFFHVTGILRMLKYNKFLVSNTEYKMFLNFRMQLYHYTVFPHKHFTMIQFGKYLWDGMPVHCIALNFLCTSTHGYFSVLKITTCFTLLLLINNENRALNRKGIIS